jgi:shikimate kinase
VDLWTRSRVQLTDEPGVIESKLVSDPGENPVLIERTVRRVLQHFHLEGKFGAKVDTWSNIPIARGLKSSSAAGNAIALATVGALNKSLDDVVTVKLGVDGAIEAKVTITGAFDDACASYFGGVVVTNNLKRKIVRCFDVAEDLTVLFHVPERKVYTIGADVDRMKRAASLVRIAYREALKGNYWSALTLNGLIYSTVLGYNSSIAIDALMAGALAAGLSGTGPAVTAIVHEEKQDLVKDVWQAYEGDVLEARANHEKAQVVA